ncbi:hypothetical protein [Undibacterium terreum]|uniref:Uncharacterized protein n=1 Tax=Undibacterium terreum TaxID=1224302 RepID=A0A916UFN8_9BURK|nr:hypothetical protein [Undibacterium terreum]GGC70682.1 hypothetical protein GCM10011396_17240 [Undibacterium terreum]
MEKALTGSTDDILIGAFRPHGRVDVRIENGIIYSDAYGPFNIELIHALVRIQRRLVAQGKLTGPLGEVIHIFSSALAGREVVDVLTQAMDRANLEGRGRVGAAFLIGPEVEGISIMLPAILACYAKVGVPSRVFERLEDAENWIRGLLDAESAKNEAAKAISE